MCFWRFFCFSSYFSGISCITSSWYLGLPFITKCFLLSSPLLHPPSRLKEGSKVRGPLCPLWPIPRVDPDYHLITFVFTLLRLFQRSQKKFICRGFITCFSSVNSLPFALLWYAIHPIYSSSSSFSFSIKRSLNLFFLLVYIAATYRIRGPKSISEFLKTD